MQTPKQTATTQEWQQGTNPIAVLFQQQPGPPSIQMAPRELTEPAQFYSVLVYAFLVSVDWRRTAYLNAPFTSHIH